MPKTAHSAVLIMAMLLAAGCGRDSTEPATSPTTSPTQSRSSRAESGSTSSTAPSPRAGRAAPPEPAAGQLPRGGRDVFPRYRLVGYAGLTGARTLGRLGTGDLDQRLNEIERRGRRYRDGRRILPVVEIIATVVHASPGKDRQFRGRLADEKIENYLMAARRHRAVLLLNIQPGRADFLDEVRAHERWLREPDVGVALDPEWAMGAKEVPGRVLGHTTGRELDGVSRYLSGLVAVHNLPEKVMVVHELAPQIITGEAAFEDHPGVAVVKSVDGIGTRGAKEGTYRRVWRGTPDFVHPGFKLFFDEDRDHGRLMTPEQVLALKPKPEYVLYE